MLEVARAAIALAALAVHVATVGRRGVLTVMIAAGLVILILLVTFDLDRPTRGLVRVPRLPTACRHASKWCRPGSVPTEPLA